MKMKKWLHSGKQKYRTGRFSIRTCQASTRDLHTQASMFTRYLMIVVAVAILGSTQAQTTPAGTPAPAAPDPRNCCSKTYPGLENEKCDLDHYCNYQNVDEWRNVNQIGWIISIITGGIVTVLVLLRDIMQVWDCFGAVDSGVQKPDRQLTTMSAAYAPNTIGEMNEPTFYKADVALGTPMPQMFVQQPMYAPMGMPMQPMGFTPNYVPQMGQPQGQAMYGSA